MTDYAKVLVHKYKGSEWTLDNNDLDSLVWLSNTTKPTRSELDLAATELDKEIAQAEAEAAAKKAAAEAKLAALGLDADDLRALGLA